MTVSALKELERLENTRLKLLVKAKKEALTIANKAVADLNSLGENYALVNESKEKNIGSISSSNLRKRNKTVPPKSRKGTRTPKDAPCPICLFQTKPPHDRRSHRMQSIKKAFSKKELTGKGFKKI